MSCHPATDDCHDHTIPPAQFRFKSKRTRSYSSSDEHPSHKHRKRRRTSYSHHRRRSNRRTASSNSHPHSWDSDPDTTFREHLFDALADDEGAAFWEGVYGQPIHIYPNTKPKPSSSSSYFFSPHGSGGGEPETEQMTDEEYTAYVRQRMGEKSHQHILEERQAREAARMRRKEWERVTEQEGAQRKEFARRMEESLRRGKVRKEEAVWREAWRVYEKRWENILGRGAKMKEWEQGKVVVQWPVKSGQASDVSAEEVERFFRNAPDVLAGRSELRAVVKAERVRWHPDKMQQRYGGRLDSKAVKLVTAVFQIIDAMWDIIRKEEKLRCSI